MIFPNYFILYLLQLALYLLRSESPLLKIFSFSTNILTYCHCHLSLLPLVSSSQLSLTKSNNLKDIRLGMRAKSFQSCPALCNPMDCSLPGSSVRGILQARMLEWVAISFSRDLPDPGINPASLVFCTGRQVLYHYCHLGSQDLE